MKAQGQKTTSAVTALTNSPVKNQMRRAQRSAAATSHVAHLSARDTMGALFASASSASRIIRWSELSPQARSARMENVPNRFVVPLVTASPSFLSTGMLSPVMTDWSMEVRPSRIVPSAGIVSPASTVRTSPARTSSAGRMTSEPSRLTRAVRGFSPISFSMPRRAFSDV